MRSIVGAGIFIFIFVFVWWSFSESNLENPAMEAPAQQDQPQTARPEPKTQRPEPAAQRDPSQTKDNNSDLQKKSDDELLSEFRNQMPTMESTKRDLRKNSHGPGPTIINATFISAELFERSQRDETLAQNWMADLKDCTIGNNNVPKTFRAFCLRQAHKLGSLHNSLVDAVEDITSKTPNDIRSLVEIFEPKN